MSGKAPKGLFVPLVTPFHADESIDYEGYKRVIDYVIEGGMDGVLVGCTTGEYHMMRLEEQKEGIRKGCEYVAGRVPVMELETYLHALEACLRVLPREVVIHRLTGDGAKRDLLAPMWSGDKKRVLNAIHQTFLRDDLEQGSALERESAPGF